MSLRANLLNQGLIGQSERSYASMIMPISSPGSEDTLGETVMDWLSIILTDFVLLLPQPERYCWKGLCLHQTRSKGPTNSAYAAIVINEHSKF